MCNNQIVDYPKMWRVEYTHEKGHRTFHKEEFYTRKAARHWCKRANKRTMVLHGPNGEVERYEHR